MRRKIAAGNWKMNGTSAALAELAAMAADLPKEPPKVVICPPAPLLFRAVEATRTTGISIGAQDCHMQASGAHSERRDAHEETNADVRNKAEAAHAAGLTPIICIGEALEDREANNTLDIIGGQLAGSLPDDVSASNTVVAYEPIWAIGTGKVPSLEQIVEVHDYIRAELVHRYGNTIGNAVPLLYGGSVKADNAALIFEAENVDGALVGGASLKAADFIPIVAALAKS